MQNEPNIPGSGEETPGTGAESQGSQGQDQPGSSGGEGGGNGEGGEANNGGQNPGGSSQGEEGQGGPENTDGDESESEIEWGQKPAQAPAPQGSEGGGEGASDEVAVLKAQVESLTKENEGLRTEIEGYKSLEQMMNDPIVASYREFLRSTPDGDPVKYLKELSMIVVPSEQSDDEIAESFFRKEAESLFDNPQEVEDAVAEKMAELDQMAKLDRKKEMNKIKSEMGLNRSKTIQEWQQDLSKKANGVIKEQALYAKRQFENFQSYFSQALEKGAKINGVKVSQQDIAQMMQFVSDSPLMMDPNFIVLAAPDENGIQDFYVPDVVKKIHGALFIDKINQTYRTEKDKARAENLTERAKNAEEARKAAELKGLTGKDLADAEYKRALEEDRKRNGAVTA